MEDRLRHLRAAIVAVGAVVAVASPVLVVLWHDGFGGDPMQSEYDRVMVGIDATSGVFLILAARWCGPGLRRTVSVMARRVAHFLLDARPSECKGGGP